VFKEQRFKIHLNEESGFQDYFNKIIKMCLGHSNGIELIPVVNIANLTLDHGTVPIMGQYPGSRHQLLPPIDGSCSLRFTPENGGV
jgi:hypothetical protein